MKLAVARCSISLYTILELEHQFGADTGSFDSKTLKTPFKYT